MSEENGRTDLTWRELLDEGGARLSEAGVPDAAEDDYLTILSVLGAECLGALRISNGADDTGDYKLLSIDDVKALAERGCQQIDRTYNGSTSFSHRCIWKGGIIL